MFSIFISFIFEHRKKQIQQRPAGQGFTFFVMMLPVHISRSIEILSTKGNKSRVSLVFFARFSNGSEKMLRKAYATPSDLIKMNEVGVENTTYLSPDDCPLYHLDWSENPMFGDFKKNYPKPLVRENGRLYRVCT